MQASATAHLMPPLLGHLQSHFAVISLRYELHIVLARICLEAPVLALECGRSGALKRYLKVCQRLDIHEVLRLFMARSIGFSDCRCSCPTAIERSFRTGFRYGSLYCNAPHSCLFVARRAYLNAFP